MPDSTDYARRVLFISSHGVVPDRDSGARRHFHLLSFLQEAGWVIHVLAADGLERATDSRRLERLGITVHDGAHEWFEDVLDDARPDLVVAAFWRNAERYLPTIRALRPDVRMIVDSVDLHFLRLARNAFGVPSKSWLGLGSEAAADYARELRAYAGSDGVLTVSEKEADMVGDLLWARDLAHVVPDFEDLEPSPVRFQDRRGMVFLGSFQHLPNVEAAVYLLTEIVPRIDKRVLDDHPLYVVGNELPEDLRRLKSIHPGIKMVGWVPDVVPYLASSRISVVPLLHGAGTKRKLLQALALGTPTVSTSVGVESFALTHEESVLIADEPASFAAAVERLLTDQKLWGHLRAAGLRLAAHANSRPDVHRAFMTAIDTVMARTPRQIVPIGIGLPHASPGPT